MWRPVSPRVKRPSGSLGPRAPRTRSRRRPVPPALLRVPLTPRRPVPGLPSRPPGPFGGAVPLRSPGSLSRTPGSPGPHGISRRDAPSHGSSGRPGFGALNAPARPRVPLRPSLLRPCQDQGCEPSPSPFPLVPDPRATLSRHLPGSPLAPPASRPRSLRRRLALGGLPTPRVDPDPAAGAWCPPVRGFSAVRAVVTAPRPGVWPVLP